MGKRRAQAPHSADTRAAPDIRGFAGIPKCVIESEAYRDLSLIARAILVELVARMDGHNNGEVHISYAELAHRLSRRNEAAIGPAIAEIMQHGFVALSAESVWQERKAREYRLTFVNTTDRIGRPIKATNDYLEWKNDTTDAVAARRKAATPFVAGKIAAATNAVAIPTETSAVSIDLPATNGVVPILLPYPLAQLGRSETACDALETASGHFQEHLRGKLIEHLKASKSGEQTRLAGRLDIPGGTLSKFINGRNLPERHAASLMKALSVRAAA